MSETKDFLKGLLSEHEDYMKTHELIRVSCYYSVEIPKDYDTLNIKNLSKFQKKQIIKLVEKFIKENEVEVIEHSEGKTRQYFKMKDGRVSEFDEITIDREPNG